ncbi:type II secretion system secretin GspD [uncultured Pseudoteredinibacter sp.]|uniref:type II secretion system secretin GspD n=1 Tax=uncultured Pseudoteredinibacter sp. TaxID=1641701 RepID=UPI00260C2343|nr:type II secretion system secretin GspD [uncultured Pseudoteredinibacter sp.]
MKKHVSLLAASIIALSGCAHNDDKQSPFSFDRILQSDEPYVAEEAPKVEVQDEEKKESQATIYKGNDRQLKFPSARSAIRLDGQAVQMNFEGAPLVDVVHAILGDTLKLDYVIEHPIKGKITLRTRSPIPRDQLLEVLESLLQANGVLMVRDPNDRYFVSASKALQTMVPQFESHNSKGAGYSTTVIPLQNIGAAEMADILKPVAGDKAFVRIDSARNILIMAGTRVQMSGWLDIISSFDIDTLKGMSVGVFPIEYADPAEIEAALGQIIASTGETAKSPSELIKLIPLERLGSLLVITPRAKLLEKVETWIKRLDKLPDSGAEPQLYVYPVQNGTASHIAELLGQLFGGGSSPSSRSGVAPGSNRQSVSDSANKSGSNQNQQNKTANKSRNGSSSVSIAGDVKVVADEDNNALLIYATSNEYRKIEKALLKLDVSPAQIMVEASIIEVTLNDSLEYGLEWSFSGGLGGGDTGLGSLANSKNAPAVSRPGFSYSLVNATGDIKAVLNALASDSLLNVISTPSIMVLDNNEASIKVGSQTPVQTGSSTTSNGIVTSNIEFKDTGVDLTVTPSVNAGGMVTMDVTQKVTDVGAQDEVSGQRSFQTREFQTRIAIRSGESVVLGGLIRENKTNGSSGVPGLHSIPVVGALFGKKSTTSVKTELLVILTPRVLFNEQDMRDISREMRARISDLTLLEGNPSK